jgi:hypothetical protein
VTAPLEVRVPTPKPVSVLQVPSNIETREKAISPVLMPPTIVVDDSTEPALSRLTASEDHVEIVKATYEDKITKLHENYQYVIFLIFLLISTNFLFIRAEIRRLTKLLGEIPSRHSSQMAELSELDENIHETIDEDPSNTNTQ